MGPGGAEIISVSEEIIELKAENVSLKSQLEERDKNKLIFQVSTALDSTVILIRNKDQFHPPELAEPIVTDEYIIKANLRARFRNRAKERILVEAVKLSLIKHSDSGSEREILPTSYFLDVYSDNGPFNADGKISLSEGLEIDGPSISPFYWYWFCLQISKQDVDGLNSDYVLRLTSIDIDQQKYSLDICVDWGSALHQSSYIFPKHLLPRSEEKD